jgi:hypothetical protein
MQSAVNDRYVIVSPHLVFEYSNVPLVITLILERQQLKKSDMQIQEIVIDV